MERFEQLPQGDSERGNAEFEAMLPLADNRVQVAIMKRWGERLGLQPSDIGLEWASSLAEKYRMYAEKNPGEEMDITDTGALERVLAEVETESDQTLH